MSRRTAVKRVRTATPLTTPKVPRTAGQPKPGRYDWTRDPIRSLVVVRAKELRISLIDLSAAIDRCPSYVSNYVTRHKPNFLLPFQAQRLAKMLQIDPYKLLTEAQRAHVKFEDHTEDAPPNVNVARLQAAKEPPADASSDTAHLPPPPAAARPAAAAGWTGGIVDAEGKLYHQPQVIPLYRTTERLESARATRFAVRPNNLDDNDACALELPMGCIRGRPGDVLVLASVPTKLQDLVVGLDSEHRVKAYGELVHLREGAATVATGLTIVELDLAGADTLLKVINTIHA